MIDADISITVRSIVMSRSIQYVCLFVCLSARITREPHGRTSPIFCACCP